MKHKTFVTYFSSGLLVSILLLILINILVDPYGVFNSDVFKFNKHPNERFIKTEYLKKNHHKYNSYMLGSSRIGNTDPKIIESFVEKSKFYNFTVAAANIYDYKKLLKWMIAEKFDIKNIYMQIDIDSYSLYGKGSNLLTKHHYDVQNNNIISFYLQYLTKFSYKTIMEKIQFNLSPDGRVYDYYDTGTWERPLKEKMLKENPNKYILNEPSFHKKYGIEYTINENFPKIIDDFKDIVNLCNENEINLICFTTPHNHKMMSTFDKNSVIKFLKEISNIKELWYFSGYNYITIDNSNYYEYSHYRSDVAKKIANKLFNHNNNDHLFGLYITKSNQDNALLIISKNIEEFTLNK